VIKYELVVRFLKSAQTDEERTCYLHKVLNEYGKGKMLYAARKAGIKHRKALWLVGNRGIRSYRSLMKQTY